MNSLIISIIFAVGGVFFAYTKITSRRGIIGKQMYQLLVVVFIITLAVSYSLLHFVLHLK